MFRPRQTPRPKSPGDSFFAYVSDILDPASPPVATDRFFGWRCGVVLALIGLLVLVVGLALGGKRDHPAPWNTHLIEGPHDAPRPPALHPD